VLELSPTDPVDVDPAHAAIVLDALLRNAWEAVAESGGRVVVRSRQDPQRGATLEIADSGSGMPKAIQERAFEPFYSTKPGHVGIGLSLAKSLWRRQRGTLTVESAALGGTLLRLTLIPPSPRAAHSEPAASTPSG
jgi:signal transduction histidine kinase